ncbi:hypothetical protein BaRGS_00031599 [Batillaria attramentaria]|uniref:G-protein coupled receptors family 1 profile domain-containing protein n=1 Tax=Batillaria attramentaria TaxID=370345 RepID=A0ABD0JPW4_9CAEN
MERNHSSHTHSLPVYILPTDSSGRAPTHASTVPGSFGPGVGLGRGKIHNAGVESGSAVYVLSEAISPTDNVDLNTHGNDLVQLSSKSLDYYQREMGSAGTLDDWDWDNGTMYNTSLGGDADTFSWGILLLAPLVVFGIAGNTLVILAISLERRLQNVTNYFLLSLAVTDLLVSLIVMPLSIINEFTGQWMFGLILCNLFVTADVFMCTSSILHLCTISLERYIGIRYPLWTKNKSKRTVFLKIVLVWTIAIAITSPITVLGIVSADNIYQDGQCSLNNQHFIIYGSIFAFFIPLLIMVVMYALTVRMLNRQAQLCGGDKEREGEPMIRRSTSRRHWQRQNRHSDLSASSSASTRNSYHREPLAATTSYPWDRQLGIATPSAISR